MIRREDAMNDSKRWWTTAGCLILAAFLVLGWFGREIYRQVPPIPGEVRTEAGALLMTRDDILTGQQVWQSIGGQQVGSIWGHGAYQAPDWTADWLHREALALQAEMALGTYGRSSVALSGPERAAVASAVQAEMRRNTYDAAGDVLIVSNARAAAMAEAARHYHALFGDDPTLSALRDGYALHPAAVPDPQRRERLSDFFFWTAWAATTERPGTAVTYTNNWPHEPLVGNRPSSANVFWSILSVALLIGGIGALVYFKVFRDSLEEPDPAAPPTDPFDALVPTASMRATAKYLVTVILLFGVQALLGAMTAHYTVEAEFFGIPIAHLLPYAVTRTWHIQLAVFWIATAFLAAGLFLAPAVGGAEPRFQRLGVNVLFGALLVVVTGSLAGEWLSVRQVFDLDTSFWLGHQGYEYTDLGRLWQILLFVGLLLWLTLMLRGLWPALRLPDYRRQLVLLFAGSSAAIGLFYGAGFFYGARTHLSVMEYWRWWVVHLWVEGFMEVFATAAMAFIFTQMGLVRPRHAVRAVIFASTIYLVAGVPGTFHHLYFSGTPVSIMAVGATFSALEVVPLALIGFEAWDTYRTGRLAAWMARYRWPIRFFLGVAFWNLVGAGIFGFLINPPIALYYMQGLNTTPLHGHAALFGVYGLLALGLVLLALRRLAPAGEWRDRPLQIAYWGMNGGLALMIVLSLLPIGLMQAYASMEHGLWFARSAEFMQQPLVVALRWLRIVGDTVFLVGVAALTWFLIGLKTGWSYARNETGIRSPGLARKAPAVTLVE
jgi:nitric oxide reductase subunit B